jgi:hypothetical protein
MKLHVFTVSVLFMVLLACNNQPGAPLTTGQKFVLFVQDEIPGASL